MTSLKSLPKPNSWEEKVRVQQDLTDKLRADTMSDIQSLQEDFQHLSLVADSIQRNYQALLAENQRIKSGLLTLVDRCYCWQEHRCDRCQQVLQLLGGFEIETTPVKLPESPQDAVRQYRTLLKQLRKTRV